MTRFSLFRFAMACMSICCLAIAALPSLLPNAFGVGLAPRLFTRHPRSIFETRRAGLA